MKKAAIYIVLLTALSRVFGFAREMILAKLYGASEITDAYIVSLTIPTILFSIVGLGITTSLIPIYLKIVSKTNSKNGIEFLNKVIKMFFFINIIFLFFLLIFLDYIVKLFTIGFSSEAYSLTKNLTFITVFCIFFTTNVSIYTAYLNSKRKFISTALIGILYNLVLIISLYISKILNYYVLAYGLVLAYALQSLFLYKISRQEGFFKTKTKTKEIFNDRNLKELLLISIPIMIGQSIDQINVITGKIIASSTAVGGISTLNYADRVNSLILSMTVMTISTVLFPKISQAAIEKNFNEMKLNVKKSLKVIALILIPATIFIVFNSNTIIKLIFYRGMFTIQDVNNTANILVYLAIGMIFLGYREILIKVFFSMQKVRIPLIVGGISMVFNVIFAILLSKIYGVSGIALATTIAAFISVVLLFLNIRKELGNIFERDVIFALITIVTISSGIYYLTSLIDQLLLVKLFIYFRLIINGCIYVFLHCAVIIISIFFKRKLRLRGQY